MLNTTLPRRRYLLLLVASVALFQSSSLMAQSVLNWTGVGADANWSNPANWQGTAPTSAEQLIFSGTTQQASVNDLSGYTNGSIVFSNGGFALSGNQVSLISGVTNLAGINTIGYPIAVEVIGTKTWRVLSGSELRLTGAISSSSTPQQNFSGGGVVRLLGGISLTSTPLLQVLDSALIVDACAFDTLGGVRLGTVGTTAECIITNNGSFSVGGASALRVGESTNGAFTVASGTVNITGTGGILLPQGATGRGTVNQNGGIVTLTQPNGIRFCQTAGGVGTYNLNAGTLVTTKISKTASGTATMNFDGGILQPFSSSTTFLAGLNTASIKAGGLTINTDSSDITIAQVLSGPGSLTKENAGTLTLTGPNTYSGSTTVNAGKVALTTGKVGSGAINVGDTAVLSVTVTAAGAGIRASSLALGSVSGSTLSFELASFGNPTVPVITATNLFTQGNVAVNISGSPLTVGQFKLIDYSGTIGGADFAAFAAPTLPAGISGFLSNNVADSSVDLVITSAGGFIWNGNINGDWDLSTANWIDETSGLSATYQDGTAVARFPDNATRSNVNVTSSFTPTAMIVSNSLLNYTFSGPGSVTTASLRKQGSGTATLATDSAFTLGRIDLDAGTLALQHPGDVTLTNIFAGPGNLIMRGGGVATLLGVSSGFTGNTLIENGTIKVGNGSALGATNGTIVITNSATLDANDQGFGRKPIVVSGSGVGGQGAMIDSTTATAIQIVSVDVMMTGDTTFGATGRWDIRAQSGTAGSPGLRGNGFKLTKVGAGFLSIASQTAANTYWMLNLGDIDIRGGTLTFAENVNLGNTNGVVTVSDGAGLNFFDLGITNPAARNVFMTNAFFRSDGGASGTNVFNGPISLFGVTNTFNVNVPLIMNGIISGAGILNKTNVSKMELNAANPFNGTLQVSAGTLAGIGSVAGDVIISGGTLAPGTSVGTFTIGGNLFATSNAVFEIDRAGSPTSDRVNVSGSINAGGTLTVTNIGAGQLQGGDSFALFNKAITGSFANVILPPLSGGLSWTNKLEIDGTIQVLGSSTSPQISSVAISGGNIEFSGSGGPAGATYHVIATSDIAVPIASWSAVATNQFDGSGNFSASIPVNPAQPQLFYTLRLP